MSVPEEKEVAEVVTCRAGEGGCAMSIIDVTEIADRLAEVLRDPEIRSRLDEKLKKPLNYHSQFCAVVTGCPNACAQPQIRDFGVTGRARISFAEDRCNECGMCEEACAERAITLVDGRPRIDTARCIGCCDCVRACQTDALEVARPMCEVTAGGKLGRHPRLAESLGEFESADDVGECLRRVLALLFSEGRTHERLGALLERLSQDE